MDTGKFIGIILAILLGIGLLYAKYGAKDRLAEKVHDDVIAQVSTLPDFGRYEGLYTGLVESHYMEMFEKHTTMTGSRRRTRVEFDREAYMDELFLAMMTDAGNQGYKAQAENLRSLRPNLGVSDGTKKPPARRRP